MTYCMRHCDQSEMSGQIIDEEWSGVSFFGHLCFQKVIKSRLHRQHLEAWFAADNIVSGKLDYLLFKESISSSFIFAHTHPHKPDSIFLLSISRL